MKTTVYDYMDDITCDDMHAISLENSNLNGELSIYNHYHRVIWGGAYYMVMSTIFVFASGVYGPFSTIEEADAEAQKQFDEACRVAKLEAVLA